MTTNIFHPSLLLLFLDPGSGIRDPGSGINIPDPPHCLQTYRYLKNGNKESILKIAIQTALPGVRYRVLRRHSRLGELTHLWEAGFSAADASVDGTPDVTAALGLLLEHSATSADFPANLAELSSSDPDELGATNGEEVG